MHTYAYAARVCSSTQAASVTLQPLTACVCACGLRTAPPCCWQVASTAKMSVGMWVRINLDDPGDGSLVKDLSGGFMTGGPNQLHARSLVRHLSRISQMGTNWIRCVHTGDFKTLCASLRAHM